MLLKKRGVNTKILLQRKKYRETAVDEELDDFESARNYRVFLYPEKIPDYEDED